MKKEIKIQIFEDGTVQGEIQGIKGKRCTNYIKILEDMLSAKTVDSNYTKEYYETEKVILHDHDYENLEVSDQNVCNK